MRSLRFYLPHACLLWSLVILKVQSVAIDNGISNGPQIECDAQALILRASTRNPFSGRIYVKGESSNPNCAVNYTQGADTNIEISVPLSGCNVKRIRNQGALEYITTVVVSFHHIFETKVDKAYRVHCVFAQLNNTFTAPSLEVSMIPTTETLTQTAGTVQCQYEVRRGNLTGPPLRYAIIGDPVFHVWKCETGGRMRILVRDCYVDDGGGNKVATIDSRGCSIDRYVIQTPNYTNPDIVYTEAHVFKYADRPTVLFQCQIQMCDATDLACQEITPPNCNGVPAPTALPNITIPQGSYLGNQTVRPVQGAADVSQTLNQTSRPPLAPANFTSPPLSVLGAANLTSPPFNLTSPPSPFNNLSTPSFPPIFGNATNLTAHAQAQEAGNASATSPHPNATLSSLITTFGFRFENTTPPFPTPGLMILGGGNRTNETALESEVGPNVTRRIRRTASDHPNQMDGYVWDVISNEFTVMDLDQELKHNTPDPPEAQKYFDDGSELKQSGFDSLAKYGSPDDQKSGTRCVAGYEVALAISVVVTLIITSTAAIAVYWNVKYMRKQILFQP